MVGEGIQKFQTYFSTSLKVQII